MNIRAASGEPSANTKLVAVDRSAHPSKAENAARSSAKVAARAAISRAVKAIASGETSPGTAPGAARGPGGGFVSGCGDFVGCGAPT
jgi:hypothetical protein